MVIFIDTVVIDRKTLFRGYYGIVMRVPSNEVDMFRWLPSRLLLCILILAVIFSGCGGGGGQGSSNNNGATKVVAHKGMSWIPPTNYTDGTPLDPRRDLDFYEIFVNQERTSPAAQVSAVNPADGTLVTSFDLFRLGAVFDNGSNSISMRAVSKAGELSDSSAPAYFSL